MSRRTAARGVAGLAAAAAALAPAGVAIPPAATSAPPAVRLLARPPATVGATWTTRLAVRTRAARAPTLLARRADEVRRASVTRLTASTFRVRLRFPTAGTWRLEARLGSRVHRLGAVSARARPAGAAVVRLDTPTHAFADAHGRLLVVEDRLQRVVTVDPVNGLVTRFAGNGTVLHSGDGGPALAAGIGSPFGIAVAPDGEVFVTSGERLRRIDTAGRIWTAAVAPAEIGPLVADARSVWFAAADARVYRYDRSSGAVVHVAGAGFPGFGGDGGPAALALFNSPHGLALTADGGLLVTDTGNDRLRRIDLAAGTVTTLAVGIGGSWGVTVAPGGTVYVGGSVANRVYRLTGDGGLVPVAGNGASASSGDGGSALEAGVPTPVGMALVGEALYVVEAHTGRIRRIELASGTISTLRRP